MESKEVMGQNESGMFLSEVELEEFFNMTTFSK